MSYYQFQRNQKFWIGCFQNFYFLWLILISHTSVLSVSTRLSSCLVNICTVYNKRHFFIHVLRCWRNFRSFRFSTTTSYWRHVSWPLYTFCTVTNDHPSDPAVCSFLSFVNIINQSWWNWSQEGQYDLLYQVSGNNNTWLWKVKTNQSNTLLSLCTRYPKLEVGAPYTEFIIILKIYYTITQLRYI